jgi:REP element-mobilizing transposase RayT
MTQARSLLVPANAHGIYHCISRCVRRAWLCGRDPLSGADHEHRRQWVEDRLAQLASVYAVSVWAYAVMSNHLHVVVEMHADIAADWSAEAVSERWLGLYPPEDGQYEAAKAMIVGSDARLAVLRSRLCSLSWFMKSLSEPIARRANAEDHCKGRFWEGRFRSQVLLDETAVLSAMTYVDLNPIRAGMTAHLEGSLHTSIAQRIRTLEAEQRAARAAAEPEHSAAPRTGAEDAGNAKPAGHTAALPPILGIRGRLVTRVSTREYLELVDTTGRQWHPAKRGRITGRPPAVLRQLGIDADQWVNRVRAVKPEGGFCRAVGSEAALLDKAAAIGQRWLRGLGISRSLAN